MIENVDSKAREELASSFQAGLADLSESLSSTRFNMWLSDLHFVAYSDKTLSLSIANLIKKDKIVSSFLPQLKAIFLRYFQDLESIEIQYNKESLSSVEKKTGSAEPEKKMPGARKKTPEYLNNSNNRETEDYSFENFLVFKENNLAFEFSQKVIDNIGRISPLYIFGEVGVGKTHILRAIFHELRRRYPHLKTQYITPDTFVGEFAMALRHKKDREFRIRYHSLDLLVVDDIQSFHGKEKSSIEFFHIFNAVYSPKKQMIIASDLEPQKLFFFDERLKSRLASSAIVEMHSPEEEKSRMQLISYFAASLKLSMAKENLEFLLEKLPNDIRKMKGAMRTLAMLREIDSKTDMNRAFLEKHLRHWFISSPDEEEKPLKEARGPVFVQPKEILHQVAKDLGVSTMDLLSSKRHTKIVKARHILIYLLRHLGMLSMAEMADFLGGRRTSTVHHGLKKIESQSSQDNQLKQYLESFKLAV